MPSSGRSISPSHPDGRDLHRRHVEFRLSVRIGATGHRSGTARLWYNDAQANSRFGLTVGGASSIFYLRSGFALGTAAGAGSEADDRRLRGPAVGGNPWKSFGTWSKTF